MWKYKNLILSYHMAIRRENKREPALGVIFRIDDNTEQVDNR